MIVGRGWMGYIPEYDTWLSKHGLTRIKKAAYLAKYTPNSMKYWLDKVPDSMLEDWYKYIKSKKYE